MPGEPFFERGSLHKIVDKIIKLPSCAHAMERNNDIGICAPSDGGNIAPVSNDMVSSERRTDPQDGVFRK